MMKIMVISEDNQCTSKPLTDTPSNMFQFVDGGLQDFFDHAKAHNFTFAGRNLVSCSKERGGGQTKKIQELGKIIHCHITILLSLEIEKLNGHQHEKWTDFVTEIFTW